MFESSSAQNTNGWMFLPMGWNAQRDQQPELLSAVQLSVPLASDDECVDVQIYGVEGRALYAERRCKPDRCAVYEIVGVGISGRPAFSPVDVELIPDGSCDDPPVLQSGLGGIIYPDDAGLDHEPVAEDAGYAGPPDAAVPVRSDHMLIAVKRQRAASHGCGVSPSGSAGLSMTWFTLAMLVLLRRRR